MRLYLFLLLYLFIPLFSLGQTAKCEAVSITQEQTFVLNSGSRAMMGGKSRTAIQINIPDNTIEWYYAIVCKRDKSAEVEKIDLFVQIARLLGTPAAMMVLSTKLLIPDGNSKADVYLTDELNKDLFMSKKDGDKFMGYRSYFRENYLKGVVKVDDITSGTCYLVIKNPSATASVNVTVEVVAIVSQDASLISKRQKKTAIFDKIKLN